MSCYNKKCDLWDDQEPFNCTEFDDYDSCQYKITKALKITLTKDRLPNDGESIIFITDDNQVKAGCYIKEMNLYEWGETDTFWWEADKVIAYITCNNILDEVNK